MDSGVTSVVSRANSQRRRGPAGRGIARAIAAVFLLATLIGACGDAAGLEDQRVAAALSRAPGTVAVRDTVVPTGPAWVKAGGNLAPGVKLYYGPQKTFVGAVQGEKTDFLDLRTGARYHGVKVQTAGGLEEWRRRAVIVQGDWYVRRDDPALAGVIARRR